MRSPAMRITTTHITTTPTTAMRITITGTATASRSQVRGTAAPHFASAYALRASADSNPFRSSRSERRRVAQCGLQVQRIPRHQFIRMLPSRQRLDAVEPLAGRGMRGRDVEAELLGRIIEIGRIGDVRDGRPFAQDE